MLNEDDWFRLICESYENPPVEYHGVVLPSFPPDQLQINTTGQAGIGTLREAFTFYQDCLDNFRELGRPLQSDDALLDFGIGWGRIARFFLRELPPRNIFGIDVTPDFVDICKRAFRTNNFIVTHPFPPTPIPSARFNVIVGYSVFSHLSEKACLSWAQEFNRILIPGGLLALTTRSRAFLDMCESLKDKGVSGYAHSLSEIFDNFDDARSKYDSGEFLHSNIEGVNGGGAMNSSFYGETFIPEAYAREAYKPYLTLERFVYDPDRQVHPIMFFRSG